MLGILAGAEPDEGGRQSAQYERCYCLTFEGRNRLLLAMRHDQVEEIFLPFKLIAKLTDFA